MAPVKSLADPARVEEIRSRLHALTPGSTRLWGRMSCPEMIRHLSDTLRMALGERAVRPVGGALAHTLVKWVALWAPLRWPRGLTTLPEVDPRRQGSRPEVFASDLAEVEALLLRLASGESGLEGRPHPFFGPLSRAAWLRWGYLHNDHHLRQFGA